MHTYIAYLICKLFFFSSVKCLTGIIEMSCDGWLQHFSTTDNQGASSHLQLPCHVVCVINLELIRDVSVTESVFIFLFVFFLNKEALLWPMLNQFNPAPSRILQSWCELHTTSKRIPVAVRQPPTCVWLPGERLPGQNTLISLFLNLISVSLLLECHFKKRGIFGI